MACRTCQSDTGPFLSTTTVIELKKLPCSYGNSENGIV